MLYQQIILLITVSMLVIILVMFFFFTKKTTTNKTWPPIIGDCPDYWVDLSGNGTACYNKQNLGTCNKHTDIDKNTMNFNVAPYNSDTTNCSKYTWATNCGVTWDGITYGVTNPCSK